MTDIRTRLTDALYGQAATFDECSQHYLKGWAERSADVLLSLPGIAIVDSANATTEWRARIGVTTVNAPDEEGARAILARWDKDSVGCIESRNVIETPWVLAAANAAEEAK